MFENLKEYYHYLENEKNQIMSYSISNKLNSIIEKTENSAEKKILSYEMFFNDLKFEKGVLIPKFSIGDKSYPELSLFDDDFVYLKSRAISEELTNPLHKAKYNHLIWKSPKKHIEFANRAIDNYFAFLTTINFIENDNLIKAEFVSSFQNLFILSEKVNYKKEEIIDFFTNHLEKDDLDGFHKYFIMDFILSTKKKLNTEHLEYFLNYSKSAIQNNLYPDFLKEYLKLMILLCSKKAISSKEYQNKLGDTYLLDSENPNDAFYKARFIFKSFKTISKSRK